MVSPGTRPAMTPATPSVASDDASDYLSRHRRQVSPSTSESQRLDSDHSYDQRQRQRHRQRLLVFPSLSPLPSPPFSLPLLSPFPPPSLSPPSPSLSLPSPSSPSSPPLPPPTSSIFYYLLLYFLHGVHVRWGADPYWGRRKRGLHAEHATHPHARQWCLRVKNPNSVSQRMHCVMFVASTHCTVPYKEMISLTK